MSLQVEIAVTRRIPAPIEAVWSLTCEFARFPDWIEFTQEMVESSSPTAGPGVTYADRNRSIGPLTNVQHWRIVEFEPPRRRVSAGEDVPFTKEFTTALELTPLGEGETEFRYSYRYTLAFGPLGRLIHAATAKSTRAAMERSLARFEEILTGAPGGI